MKKKSFLASTVIILLAVLTVAICWAVPAYVSYQGRLLDDMGDPITSGGLAMKFRVFDSETAGTLLWEEDQTVVVDNGIYNVHLGSGSTTVGSFDPALFSSDSRWFEVEVDSEVMTPRIQATSVPYAMQSSNASYATTAGNAETLDGRSPSEFDQTGHVTDTGNPHGVTAGQTGSASISDINWANLTGIPAGFSDDIDDTGIETEADPTVAASVKDGVSWAELSGVPSGFADNVDDVGGIISEDDPQVGSNTTNYVPIWNGSALVKGSIFDNGNVGIGTSNPLVKLSLGIDINNKKLALYDGINDFYGLGVGAGRITFYASDSEKMTIWNNGYVGIGTPTPTTMLAVKGENAVLTLNQAGANMDSGVRLRRDDVEEWFVGIHRAHEDYDDLVFQSDGNSEAMRITKWGSVGIGTNSPSQRLDVAGGNIRVKGPGNFNLPGDEAIVYLGGYSSSIRAVLDDGVHINTSHGAGSLTVKDNTGSVGIGISNPSQKLDVDEGNILVQGSGSFDAADDEGIVYLGSTHNYIKGVYGSGVHIGGYNASDAIVIKENSSDVVVSGDLIIKDKTTGETLIELGEGLDYAEGFNVSDLTKIEPGSVLIIDSENPGKLTLSNKSYDTKVAGIVAGANEMGSGVRLGAGQFDYDVALAGRVYCKVDATEAGIKTGDLLTSSAIPGHAMKVTDHIRAHGTILGKAMEPLEKGKSGEILVLVTLQ